MAKLYLTLMLAASSVAGFGLILYGALTGSRRETQPLSGNDVTLSFSDSEDSGPGILDLDIGHEGLKHRGKEAFDPVKHKPEPLESKKKI
jgi:hypothetical protein